MILYSKSFYQNKQQSLLELNVGNLISENQVDIGGKSVCCKVRHIVVREEHLVVFSLIGSS
jgi:hypothetical protein